MQPLQYIEFEDKDNNQHKLPLYNVKIKQHFDESVMHNFGGSKVYLAHRAPRIEIDVEYISTEMSAPKESFWVGNRSYLMMQMEWNPDVSSQTCKIRLRGIEREGYPLFDGDGIFYEDKE